MNPSLNSSSSSSFLCFSLARRKQTEICRSKLDHQPPFFDSLYLAACSSPDAADPPPPPHRLSLSFLLLFASPDSEAATVDCNSCCRPTLHRPSSPSNMFGEFRDLKH
ncbi:hypothetical protein QVD17_12412 [Tagetes erecta]|uniref:Uncharacterized protein n=1 Tax=Tagetes erecta TaxID=13708 RepID=A0AAD8KWL9_TARER|nr:hypothetical protein QVD17_12412 [Tagetes erecta]